MNFLNGSYPYFQEESNALKYVLFGFCMNTLWIFKVLSIASLKTWVDSTKTMIQHDLQLVYVFGLLQCHFSIACILPAYLRKWGSPGFKKTTLTHVSESMLPILCQNTNSETAGMFDINWCVSSLIVPMDAPGNFVWNLTGYLTHVLPTQLTIWELIWQDKARRFMHENGEKIISQVKWQYERLRDYLECIHYLYINP